MKKTIFIEAPKEQMTDIMENWAKDLKQEKN